MAEKTARELPVMTVPPIPTPFVPDDWKVVKDVGLAPDGTFAIQFDKLLRDDETYIGGEAGLERAEEMGELAGESHAKRIMDRRDLIPVECRSFALLILGTVRSDSYGGRRVLYFCWDGVRWYSDWFWLGDDLCSFYRVVRLSK